MPLENRAFLRFETGGGRIDSLNAAVTVRVTKTSNIQLTTSVNHESASQNDTLFYTLSWVNTGVGPASQLVVADSLPAGVLFIPGSVSSSGSVITAVADDKLVFNVADALPGHSGFVRFGVIVTLANGEISNSSRATYASEDEVRDAVSNTIRTHIEPWSFKLEAIAVLPDTTRPLHVGDTLSFNVGLTNQSSELELRNVFVTDTLPTGLQYLSSIPAPYSINGVVLDASRRSSGLMSMDGLIGANGGVIVWLFESIQPGEQVQFVLKTKVIEVGSGVLKNSFAASGNGLTDAQPIVSTSVPVSRQFGLAITKSASSLDVGTGEAVGFTVQVRNTGNTAIEGVVIHDIPAKGVSIQSQSVSGAELTRAGGELLLDAGTIEPGAIVTVQYVGTITGARGSVLENRAWARATSGTQSDTAKVVVRVRAAAMLSRVVMGKVWLDENGDGRQQSTERPLASAVVWSSHGETVRADSLGRFTFRDVNTGRYTFRVDPLSVPAGFDNAQPISSRVDGWSTPVVSFAIPRGKALLANAVKPAGAPLTGFALNTTGLSTEARITAPANGAVLPTNKMSLRVQGEPGAEVQLYDNAAPIGKTVLRPDGSADLLDITVAPGPHVIAGVITLGANTKKTSVTIHVSGDPKTVVRGDTAVLRAGRTQVMSLQVLDQWKKPVAQKPYATVAANGLRVLDADVDPSSVGLQLPVSTDGTLLMRVVGDSAGVAHMKVSFGRDETPLDLIMLPEIRSLVVLADGEIGAGASANAYGAISARGSIDSKTSVTLSYDSRRTNRETFGGAFDPLGESRYAILGDASERTVLGSATTPLSMRVERERDWLLLGDIDTRAFGSDNSPAAYRRALPGMSGHWLNGPVDVYGFGSMVSQAIVQKQVRGDGTSGPYNIGGAVRLGTDRLVIETRDRLNASIVISRLELERFVDYDIDATTGSVLLRRPLASTDAAGNPIMLVATAEQLHGASAFVGGLHAQVAASPFKSTRDTVSIGGGYIEDQSPLGAHRLISGELGMNLGWAGSSIEVAHGESIDSAGVAMHASAWLGSRTGTGAMFEWNRVGDGFANPANPRLISGTQDMRVSARAAMGRGWSFGGAFNRQEFRSRGAERSQGAFTLGRTVGDKKLLLDLGIMDEKLSSDTLQADYRSFTSRLSMTQRRSTAWLESTQPLNSEGPARPATYGIGASYDLGHGIRAEASQRLMRTDSATQSLSTFALRSEFSTGTRAWTEYQLGSSVSGASSAALVGIGQKLRLSSAWSVDAQYERREGLGKLPETDPARALPFTQQEQNRWAASLGTEWTPTGIKARAGLRGELHDSEETGRGYRIFGSGEAAISNSLSLLVREDTREDRRVLGTGLTVTRASQTILAGAFRPASRSDWNSLVKLEWRNDENPLRAGGSLLTGTNRRVIGAAETVWTPSTKSELGLRFALRRSELGGMLAADNTITSVTQYIGGRLRQQITDRIDVRANTRVLIEQRAGLSRWDLAPAAGIRLVQGLDLETGYRFGNLVDADFAQNGGSGFYMTLGMSLTEQSGKSIADFWRARLGGSNR